MTDAITLARQAQQLAAFLAERPHPSSAVNALARQVELQALAVLRAQGAAA
jgi:hypothetical protein